MPNGKLPSHVLGNALIDTTNSVIGRLEAYEREIAAKDAAIIAMQEEIDAWKTSSLLVDGGGDPSGITPRHNEQNVYNLTTALARAAAVLQDTEGQMVTILRDQEMPIYACRYCNRVGMDEPGAVEHADWCIVTKHRAALADPVLARVREEAT